MNKLSEAISASLLVLATQANAQVRIMQNPPTLTDKGRTFEMLIKQSGGNVALARLLAMACENEDLTNAALSLQSKAGLTWPVGSLVVPTVKSSDNNFELNQPLLVTHNNGPQQLGVFTREGQYGQWYVNTKSTKARVATPEETASYFQSWTDAQTKGAFTSLMTQPEFSAALTVESSGT